jgi:ankyrin repeat protein
MTGNISCTQTLLLQGADINMMDEKKLTPLHLACLNNHDNIVFDLLSKNHIATYSQPDFTIVDEIGRTVLHAAAYGSTGSVVQILLSKNAALDAQDNNQRTPLLW